MKVLFCYKWKRDPGDAALNSDRTLKWFFTTLKPSDDESAAIVCARQIAEVTGGEINGVTIGDGDPSWALARGAKKVTSVAEYLPQQDEAVLGAQLANAINAAGDYDVILLGDNVEYAGAAAVAAVKLGLPLVAGVASIKYDEAYPDSLIATRVTDEAQETLKIKLPAVVTVAAVDSEKVRPTMRQMMAAKKLPVDKVNAAELPAIENSKMELISAKVPEMREAQLVCSAEELVDILRSKKLL